MGKRKKHYEYGFANGVGTTLGRHVAIGEAKQHALIITCDEARVGEVFVAKGTRAWVVYKEWSGPTGVPLSEFGDALPEHLVTFVSRDKAREFALEWGGHPRTIRPLAYEIVDVCPVVRCSVVGFARFATNEGGFDGRWRSSGDRVLL